MDSRFRSVVVLGVCIVADNRGARASWILLVARDQVGEFQCRPLITEFPRAQEGRVT